MSRISQKTLGLLLNNVTKDSKYKDAYTFEFYDSVSSGLGAEELGRSTNTHTFNLRSILRIAGFEPFIIRQFDETRYSQSSGGHTETSIYRYDETGCDTDIAGYIDKLGKEESDLLISDFCEVILRAKEEHIGYDYTSCEKLFAQISNEKLEEVYKETKCVHYREHLYQFKRSLDPVRQSQDETKAWLREKAEQEEIEVHEVDRFKQEVIAHYQRGVEILTKIQLERHISRFEPIELTVLYRAMLSRDLKDIIYQCDSTVDPERLAQEQAIAARPAQVAAKREAARQSLFVDMERKAAEMAEQRTYAQQEDVKTARIEKARKDFAFFQDNRNSPLSEIQKEKKKAITQIFKRSLPPKEASKLIASARPTRQRRK